MCCFKHICDNLYKDKNIYVNIPKINFRYN